MAEISSHVYDIVHPTPVSLKELSAMTISLRIWRCEVTKHRESNTLEDFRPTAISREISGNALFPDLPSTIADIIEEYIKKFAYPLTRWLHVHNPAAFQFHHYNDNYILKEFDDFVCDYNGTVHYERTAQRMVHSDRLSDAVKFRIACMYFLEDDIRRLWPSVCTEMDSDDIDFNLSSGLFYWICSLENELDEIPIGQGNGCVDEVMFDKCTKYVNNGRSVLYFWYRIPLESRMRKARYLYTNNRESFLRFLLPKLDDKELADFVNARGFLLMHSLLVNNSYDEAFILPTWMYIRHLVGERTLTGLLSQMLRYEDDGFDELFRLSRHSDTWTYCCSEILNSVSGDLKQSIIRNILSNDIRCVLIRNLGSSLPWRTVKLLSHILSCVTFEERNKFWQEYWLYLIPRTRVNDLQQIMKMCFENDVEIAQFKENVIAESEILREVCVSLLRELGIFHNELNKLVSFCYPDAQAARSFKLKLLQSAFLAENPSVSNIVYASKEFSKFIDDVYQNPDLSDDFKNQLMSSPSVQNRLSRIVCSESFRKRELKPIEFIETLVSSEQTMRQIKTCMIDAFKAQMNHNLLVADNLMSLPDFKKFLLWCFGSKEEFTKFEIFFNSKFERM